MSVESEDESWAYQAERLSALASDPLVADDSGLARAWARLQRRGPGDFAALCAEYGQTALALAHRRAARAEPAARYPDMEAFFADAQAQEAGESDRTFWDTYEHGRRRRLEAQLASAYGSESALLVNSGMSALDCAIRGWAPLPGRHFLASSRQYFETSDYVDAILVPGGATVHRWSADSAPSLRAAAGPLAHATILLEAFLNGPEVDPMPEQSIARDCDEVVLDNSVLGHAARWIVRSDPRLLVVESGLKYLCQRCSSGVVYGARERIEVLRRYARRTGVQLQAAALHHLNAFEIALCARRIRLHGARRRQFREVVQAGPWQWIRDGLDAAVAADPICATTLVESGGGPLLFLAAAPPDAADGPRRHRDIVRLWRELCDAATCPIAVQAGFGWDWTSCRAYDGNYLNRQGAGSYIRISVGLAPPAEVRRSAELLNKACATVLASKA